MRMRRFAVLGTGAAGLVLAAAASLLPAARAEDNVDEKVKEFQEYLKTNPDSQSLRNHIADLALLKKPQVADALMPLLKNPKLDDDVKIAVCQSVGKQGKPAVAAILMGLADSKTWEEKPKLRAAALEGVGEADAKTNYKELLKLAKKYLPTNGDIAIAAIKSCSLLVTHDSVEDLVTMLGVISGGLKASEASKRPHYDAERPVLIECLKKMTGLDYGEPDVWKRWWDDNKKTWEPSVPGKDKPKDLNASETFADAALGFSIKKPSKRWTFRKADSGPVITLEALEEGQRAAWCDVFVQSTKNMTSKTPEALAKEIRDHVEPKFRDIKPGFVWDKPCSYGGAKGVEHIVVGQHKDFDAVHVHNVFLVKSEMSYRFECYYKSGKSAALETDIEEFLKSIVITR
jgi:HEAT repeat protein